MWFIKNSHKESADEEVFYTYSKDKGVYSARLCLCLSVGVGREEIDGLLKRLYQMGVLSAHFFKVLHSEDSIFVPERPTVDDMGHYIESTRVKYLARLLSDKDDKRLSNVNEYLCLIIQGEPDPFTKLSMLEGAITSIKEMLNDILQVQQGPGGIEKSRARFCTRSEHVGVFESNEKRAYRITPLAKIDGDGLIVSESSGFPTRVSLKDSFMFPMIYLTGVDGEHKNTLVDSMAIEHLLRGGSVITLDSSLDFAEQCNVLGGHYFSEFDHLFSFNPYYGFEFNGAESFDGLIMLVAYTRLLLGFFTELSLEQVLIVEKSVLSAIQKHPKTCGVNEIQNELRHKDSVLADVLAPFAYGGEYSAWMNGPPDYEFATKLTGVNIDIEWPNSFYDLLVASVLVNSVEFMKRKTCNEQPMIVIRDVRMILANVLMQPIVEKFLLFTKKYGGSLVSVVPVEMVQFPEWARCLPALKYGNLHVVSESVNGASSSSHLLPEFEVNRDGKFLGVYRMCLDPALDALIGRSSSRNNWKEEPISELEALEGLKAQVLSSGHDR